MVGSAHEVHYLNDNVYEAHYIVFTWGEKGQKRRHASPDGLCYFIPYPWTHCWGFIRPDFIRPSIGNKLDEISADRATVRPAAITAKSAINTWIQRR